MLNTKEKKSLEERESERGRERDSLREGERDSLREGERERSHKSKFSHLCGFFLIPKQIIMKVFSNFFEAAKKNIGTGK